MNLFTKIDLIEPSKVVGMKLSNNFDLKLHDDLSGIDGIFVMESFLIEIVGQTQKILLLKLSIDHRTRMLMLSCLNIMKLYKNSPEKTNYVI